MDDNDPRLLQEIQAEMRQWSSLSYWKSFIYQIAVAESIAAYGKRLDRMTKKFQVRSAIRVLGCSVLIDLADWSLNSLDNRTWKI